MKILIADSGSTKTHWCMVDTQKGAPSVAETLQTQGLNPLQASAEVIADTLGQVLLQTQVTRPDALFFYGAGCSGERVALVEAALRRKLTPMTHVEVASDLLGACRALYPTSSGIACIMGTGSIAARYDSVSDQMQAASSLGYILGDEGSGGWLGRQLLSDYLKEQMPPRVRTLFEQDFGPITAESAIQHVYQAAFPNRYLASFAVFVGSHPELSYCQKLAFDGVDAFFRRNVSRLAPRSDEPISFVGSVAWHLRDTLQCVAALHNLQLATVMPAPMDGLLRFHLHHSKFYFSNS